MTYFWKAISPFGVCFMPPSPQVLLRGVVDPGDYTLPKTHSPQSWEYVRSTRPLTTLNLKRYPLYPPPCPAISLIYSYVYVHSFVSRERPSNCMRECKFPKLTNRNERPEPANVGAYRLCIPIYPIRVSGRPHSYASTTVKQWNI